MAGAQERSERNLYLDALAVAIDTTVNEAGQWYTSMKELQIVCLDLCVACRSSWKIISTLSVVVTAGTPRRLWLRGEQETSGKKMLGWPRVPPLPVRAVTVLELPRRVLSRLLEGDRRVDTTERGGLAMGCMRWLCRFGPSPLWWSDAVRELSMQGGHNHAVRNLVWPPLLQQLSFGWKFNQPIEGVVWPASLQRLSLGECFNQPIEGVVWPASLQQLSLGWKFNQPIAGVVWPASLQRLSLGNGFNQPIAGVVWPASLQHLWFGHGFNQPIAGGVWPAALQQMSFGWKFNQPVTGVVWPGALRQLSFGDRLRSDFVQPIQDVVWPASLKLLTVKRTSYLPHGDDSDWRRGRLAYAWLTHLCA